MITNAVAYPRLSIFLGSVPIETVTLPTGPGSDRAGAGRAAPFPCSKKNKKPFFLRVCSNVTEYIYALLPTRCKVTPTIPEMDPCDNNKHFLCQDSLFITF
jgi:hypothetical protein